MSGYTVLQTFTMLNFLLQKWWPFQYNVKFQTKASFIIVLLKLLSKSLWTKFRFLTKNLGIYFRVWYFFNLYNLQCSATKRTALAIEHKNRKENSLWLFFSLVFCEKLYEKNIIFQLMFAKSISRCNIMRVLKYQKFIY